MRMFTYEAWKFWKREEQRRNLKIAKINWGFGVAPEYERLLSFFHNLRYGPVRTEIAPE